MARFDSNSTLIEELKTNVTLLEEELKQKEVALSQGLKTLSYFDRWLTIYEIN